MRHIDTTIPPDAAVWRAFKPRAGDALELLGETFANVVGAFEVPKTAEDRRRRAAVRAFLQELLPGASAYADVITATSEDGERAALLRRIALLDRAIMALAPVEKLPFGPRLKPGEAPAYAAEEWEGAPPGTAPLSILPGEPPSEEGGDS